SSPPLMELTPVICISFIRYFPFGARIPITHCQFPVSLIAAYRPKTKPGIYQYLRFYLHGIFSGGCSIRRRINDGQRTSVFEMGAKQGRWQPVFTNLDKIAGRIIKSLSADSLCRQIFPSTVDHARGKPPDVGPGKFWIQCKS